MVEVADKRVQISGLALEGKVVDVIRRWALAYPDELVSLGQLVKALRRDAQHAHAITPQGCLLHKAEIPVTLDAYLRKEIDKEWIYNHEIRLLVLRNFPVGCVNRTSEMKR